MSVTRNNLTIFILFLLLFSHIGAIVHAAEHVLEYDDEYCEICSLIDHQSDGVICSNLSLKPVAAKQEPLFYSNILISSIRAWDHLSRAPPQLS